MRKADAGNFRADEFRQDFADKFRVNGKLISILLQAVSAGTAGIIY